MTSTKPMPSPPGRRARLKPPPARGARVVLSPEYSSYFVDPFDETLAAAAQDVDGPFVRELIRIAGDHGVHVVAGLLERAGDGKRVRNTVVAVDGGATRAL